MTDFTVRGRVLSAQEYLDQIGDAPLRHNLNAEGWVLLDDNPLTYRFFPGLLVQPEIDVQVGTVIHVAYETCGGCVRMIDWRIEEES